MTVSVEKVRICDDEVENVSSSAQELAKEMAANTIGIANIDFMVN
ncbi:hypothetical protein HMPREF9136_0113 [Prevotella dentalis DSM 3688]|uniref:Uncharacterized protein n=1 Tax=Prevotella dentalis (strain ATCC 49559 / DSM 3688 / JCM 13448 / NCTC 12043 / ES 2772) TaxID=908937 RepID=F9CZT6_PREDD|nr:hypothetical protein HMPREF9136_0113 [Prevotella dentalis DSM 3688]